MPGQSPPANVVAFTVGAADCTIGAGGGVDGLVVSATIMFLPSPGDVLSATAKIPMAATAPAAMHNDTVLSDPRILIDFDIEFISASD
jgi:hypothetical protein